MKETFQQFLKTFSVRNKKKPTYLQKKKKQYKK